MDEHISLNVSLTIFIRKEKKSRWVAICPTVGVASQGSSKENARQSVKEAVELWFESCIERGVLDQALRELNFRPLVRGESPFKGDDTVTVRTAPADEFATDVRGDHDSINFALPAYQAAAFLSAGA